MPIMHKNVSYFQISVNDIFLGEVIETIEDIFNDWLSSVLIEIAIFSESGLEITLITKFSNYITVTIAGKNFKASENIRVTKFFQNIDFWEKKLLELFALEGLQLYDFNSHNFSYIDEEILVFYLLAL